MDKSVLEFIEYDLQAIALIWMAVLYTIKIYQLAHLPMPWEKADPKGSAKKGVALSYGSIAMPWVRESSRKHLFRWLEFGFYHIGALVAIINTFTMPFAPSLMTPTVKTLFAILIIPSFVVGFLKLGHRITKKELRIISTPDDYFSLISMQFFLGLAIVALLTVNPVWRMWYFIVTAFFLFYVPFSKISHYIYFFFAHYLTGSRYGWRGIIPAKHS